MIVVGCGVVREELEGIPVDVITTKQDIELTEEGTASKGSQSLPQLRDDSQYYLSPSSLTSVEG